MDSLQLDTVNDPHKLHEALKYVVHLSKRSFVMTGRILHELKKDDKYMQAVGKGADTWKDYLRQPEIGLSEGEASRLMQIYEEFILRLGYDEDTISSVPVKNMHYLLPLAKRLENKEEVDELVADATLLSQKDFKERIFDVKVEESGGDLKRTFEYVIMRKTLETGAMDRVHEIDSDMIKRMFKLE